MDLVLAFPPQWSPFQPPLAMGALAAWLRREAYEVIPRDLNLELYEWLFTDDAGAQLAETLQRSTSLSRDQKTALAAVLEARNDFACDLELLRDRTRGTELLAKTYRGTRSVATYLGAVSAILERCRISLFELSIPSYSISELMTFAENPPAVLAEWATSAAGSLRQAKPNVWGLSCIGQEQLPMTLLLGRLLKEQSDAPVVVGGTILSRLFERGRLPEGWFGRYFDGVVRHEGERPLARLLGNLRGSRAWWTDVPGLLFRDGNGIATSQPAAPLSAGETPVPDFDGLPLARYLAPELTLPILASRGCYWGKCEFCHHGMVYGGRYTPASAPSVRTTVETLAARYGARSFAFNDEAIPPKTAAALADLLPSHDESGWTFTGLIKFEKYYTPEIFRGMQRVGFRSLYVGLESASERVLALMKKNTRRTTMAANLTDATNAGIWFHTFLFFGFPGETDEEARTTHDFVLTNFDIISSFGASTFRLEHNAPIFHHTSDFGVTLRVDDDDEASVYYPYRVEEGIPAKLADVWLARLIAAADRIPKYRCTRWIPREHLLTLLRDDSPDALTRRCIAIDERQGLPEGTTVSQTVSLVGAAGRDLVVHRLSFGVAWASNAAREALLLAREADVPVDLLCAAPTFARFLSPAPLRQGP